MKLCIIIHSVQKRFYLDSISDSQASDEGSIRIWRHENTCIWAGNGALIANSPLIGNPDAFGQHLPCGDNLLFAERTAPCNINGLQAKYKVFQVILDQLIIIINI